MMDVSTAPKTVAFHTLGCKLNFSETATLRAQLHADGFESRAFDGEESADVYVLNTCSVTEAADKECRHLVRRIQRRAPEALIVVTGCYAQLKPAEIASIPGVNLVLGAGEKFNLTRHLRELSKGDSGRISSCDISEVRHFHPSDSGADRTRVFLKVQDGCDYGCSFCTIPKARGASRSDSVEGVVDRVQSLAGKGVKEVVLTGVNLGDFGKGFEGGRTRDESFLELIAALDEVDGIERFRISSIEPNLLSEEIIRFVAGSQKFMPHFHVPLQSGCDRILGLMRRRYRRDLYEERVAQIRAAMPHACIGADVIVGFPSESDNDFRETLDFLTGLDLSYLHVFTYSERASTLAIEIEPAVPMNIRHNRNKMLRALSFKKMQAFTARFCGTERSVLWERAPHDGMMEGYTDNYIRVQTPYRAEWANEVMSWRL